MRHSAKHVVEYLFVRAVVGLFRILPALAAAWIGVAIAAIGHFLVRYRADLARQRMADMFPGRFSDREIRRMAWLSWRNFILGVVDMARLDLMSTDWLKRHAKGFEEGMAAMKSARNGNLGAVAATFHAGSWEMCLTVGRRIGFPIFVFATPQKNRLVDDYITRLRQSTGITCIRRGTSSLRDAVRRLQNGELMGILPDVRIPTQGLKVRFLGREANVGGGMASMARLAGVPVVTCLAARTGLTSYEGFVWPPIQPDPSLDRDEDARRVTQKVFDIISEFVTAHPEQWFWFNKRWIFDPVPQRA